MRTLKRALPSVSILLLLAVIGAAPLAAQAFEGTLTFVAHGVDGDKTITEWVKGSDTRYDFASAGSASAQGTMIIDGKAKTRTVVMPARKAYMTAPYDPAARKPGPGEKSDVKWTRTGKTETVAGVKCEVIHGVGTENGKPKEADICVAKGLGFGGGSTGGGPFSEALTEYANLSLAPGEGIVKMTSIEGGKPAVQLELTKVDRHSLAAADFQPPAGFTKIDRPMPAPKP
jgi:hypothetical protein